MTLKKVIPLISFLIKIIHKKKIFIKYTAASIFALLFDYIFYIYLIYAFNFIQQIAGTVSYFSGLMISFLLIYFFNKKEGWKVINKKEGILLFMISGLIGSLITLASLITYNYYFIAAVHHPMYGKIFASLFSFLSVYLFRKKYILK